MNLSELEEHVLHRLAANRVTHSSVALAAELWEGETSPFTFDMVRWILIYLNKLGYITYRVQRTWSFTDEEGAYEPGEIPVYIRVTDLGYTTLGYKQHHRIVQQFSPYGDSVRPGDPTDFRNQHFRAPFEPCEVLTVWEHARLYPDHPHPPDWWPLTKEAHMSEDISSISQRNQILLALQIGPAKSLEDLRRRVGREITQHTLAHLVWNLQKARHVTFREIGSDLRRITLTPDGKQKVLELEEAAKSSDRQTVREAGPREVKGRRPIGKDMTDPSQHGSRAQGGPIERSYVTKESEQMLNQNTKVETDLTKIPPYFVPGYTNVHAKTAYRFVENLSYLGKPGTISEVARIMGVGSPTTTQQAKAALHYGWIELTKPDGNRKPYRITDLGNEVLRANQPKGDAPDVPVTDEESVTPPEARNVSAEVPHTRKDETPDTHTQYPLESYPLIADLMGKEKRLAKYEQAAALLEEDDAEMALALLEKIQLTDLEREVIKFVRGLSAQS